MDLYARVNILGGRAVRLPRGDVRDAIALVNDPLQRVRGWLAQGADYVHVVDLDAAAYADAGNRSLIDRIVDEAGGPIQVAGGIRSHVEAARLLERGAWRIVMGTAAIEAQNMVWDLCRDHPDKIAVSLDVRPDGEIATRGWTQNSGRFLEEVLIEMSAAGAAAFMVSQAGRDVLTEPANLQILSEALATVEEPVIAAGGARDLDDLARLIALSIHGRSLGGVVVGREVTEGRFTLTEAKDLIAAGPPPEPEEPAPAPAERPLSPGHSDGYLKAADAAAEAAQHARLAARHHQSGDGAQVAVHVSAARRELATAAEQLDALS